MNKNTNRFIIHSKFNMNMSILQWCGRDKKRKLLIAKNTTIYREISHINGILKHKRPLTTEKNYLFKISTHFSWYFLRLFIVIFYACSYNYQMDCVISIIGGWLFPVLWSFLPVPNTFFFFQALYRWWRRQYSASVGN